MESLTEVDTLFMAAFGLVMGAMILGVFVQLMHSPGSGDRDVSANSAERLVDKIEDACKGGGGWVDVKLKPGREIVISGEKLELRGADEEFSRTLECPAEEDYTIDSNNGYRVQNLGDSFILVG